ncbi:hypothetical protein BDQ12DRAFT_605867 [Crucibulum laeve]|uniref:Oxidoreductase AflY n=1 Tax=Crucibulum laeve TaxID=68775 RepID=A0A5C3LZD0_9AGAR|nr:hypothetical protein BDQ12DRAFT_605867 [Crucibulum laeve]
MSSNSTLDALFPSPSAPPSRLSPAHWPGVNLHSAASLQKVLKDNHEKWHVFFNDKQFHNHAAHRALALWALGSDGGVIEAGYEKDISYEKPAFESPEAITEDNFSKHLGNEKFYHAYLEFFTKKVEEKGIPATLDEFIFSKKANIGMNEHTSKKDRPQMLSRFLSGVIHPMIHTGHAAEFGLPGMLAEGLAQTAVHPASSTPLIPPSLFDINIDDSPSDSESTIATATKMVESLTEHLDAALSVDPTSTAKPASVLPATPTPAKPHTTSSDENDVHAVTILARVLADKQFASSNEIDETKMYATTLKKYGSALVKHTAQWTLDLNRPGEVERKMEEVIWVNALIYGVGGWTERGEEKFNADFFFMHLVTSSLFLPSLLALIPPHSQVLLLRTYLATSLAWYIARGRPALAVSEFFAASHTSTHPIPAGPQPTANKEAIFSESQTPNPWLPIIQSSIVHPDEHVPKLQRSLAHWAAVFGEAEKGALGETELPGGGEVDGTLFIRAAGLTVQRMGWVREGEEKAEFWDRTGFYKKT